MEDRNCELLFEYLRSILYDSEVKTLEIDSLDEPFRKLGMGLQYLETAVKEMKQCSAALSKGDLSSFKPARENFLCENLKNIHANLNHLTWQAKQVAKGDYSQTVSYLGEFSEAFNTMTEQLRERERSLKLIVEQEKKHAEMAESYSQLLMELIARSEEEILVISLDGQSLLYSNRRTEDEMAGRMGVCEYCSGSYGNESQGRTAESGSISGHAHQNWQPFLSERKSRRDFEDRGAGFGLLL